MRRLRFVPLALTMTLTAFAEELPAQSGTPGDILPWRTVEAAQQDVMKRDGIPLVRTVYCQSGDPVKSAKLRPAGSQDEYGSWSSDNDLWVFVRWDGGHDGDPDFIWYVHSIDGVFTIIRDRAFGDDDRNTGPCGFLLAEEQPERAPRLEVERQL